MYSVHLVSAWGHEGHIITVEFADAFLTESAKKGICELIPSCNLSDIANWADETRNTHPWSAPLHYVNTEDCPPIECSFNMNRDCKNNFCVVGAILNYTNQLLHPQTKYNKSEALFFLVHFIGDLHQPLHVSGRDLGGNSFNVYFYGQQTNLHKVWDTLIVQRRTSQDGGQYYQFLTELILLTKTVWANQTDSWLKCQSSSQFSCPEEWAEEAVTENCGLVWPTNTCSPNDRFIRNVEEEEEEEDWAQMMQSLQIRMRRFRNHSSSFSASIEPSLGDSYYLPNLPVVQMQIAKAGMRIANVLNHIWK